MTSADGIRRLAAWTRKTGRLSAAGRMADELDRIADERDAIASADGGDAKQAPALLSGAVGSEADETPR